MNEKEKAQHLTQFEIFHGLNEKELMGIAKYIEDKTFSKHTTIITEGTTENDIYFIVSGLIRIYHLHENGKEMTIAVRLPGEVIGEMAAIDNSSRSANAQTLENTRVFILPKKSFYIILQKFHIVNLRFLKILSLKLREALQRQKSFSFENLKERTYHILQILSFHSPQGITISHQDLSFLVNATQPRITEVLHTLKDEEKISMSRKKIFLN